jgi:phosphatidate cytidylyltransferase
MLYLRVLSAIVGIPIVLAAVYFGGLWYALLLLIVVNLGIYEYCRIFKSKDYQLPLVYGLLGVTLFLAVIYFEQIDLVYPLIIILFACLYMHSLFRMDRFSIAEAAIILWGIIYLGGLGGYMLMLRMLPEGAFYTYLLLFSVWLHDTLAYFIGTKWGVRKFAPLISPNKSVEGSMAGILGLTAIMFSTSILFPTLLPLAPLQALFFGLGIAVFAQLGDLLESALKRQIEVKDSGALIPGHGGILDRFDSLLFTAPFVYYFFLLISTFRGIQW